MSALPTCMYVHLKCHKGPHGSEEGIGFPGAEVSSCITAMWLPGIKPGSSAGVKTALKP